MRFKRSALSVSLFPTKILSLHRTSTPESIANSMEISHDLLFDARMVAMSPVTFRELLGFTAAAIIPLRIQVDFFCSLRDTLFYTAILTVALASVAALNRRGLLWHTLNYSATIAILGFLSSVWFAASISTRITDASINDGDDLKGLFLKHKSSFQFCIIFFFISECYSLIKARRLARRYIRECTCTTSKFLPLTPKDLAKDCLSGLRNFLTFDVWLGFLALCVEPPWTVYEGRKGTYTVLTAVIDLVLLTFVCRPLRLMVHGFFAGLADPSFNRSAENVGCRIGEVLLSWSRGFR
ncbi:hypothetical protein K491DRAFT_308713 [Lophiostoma macrostomum CBS 122681]|uniref:Uncharacterized protein n=1 Tax=Lophiostoma macrostomum CBS 122681 TaxID=1314788 RepID=A0A6A6TFA9_9PLEO|nr:hypothetical protein K491DRAFT_308713 [Lophiostoma macrostomum CBS 122681]